MGRSERGSSRVGEVINWEEKYVSYVEGDLRRDIQELKNGQERLDAKIDTKVQELRDGQKSLDAKIEKVEDDLRKEIKEVGTKIEKVEDNLRKDIKGIEDSLRKEIKEISSKYFWPIFLLVAAGVIGGLAKLWIR